MNSTKKCPLCAETIPAAAPACKYCGTQFKVTSSGYCINCHALRDANETSHCRVCGNEVADWRVESQFVETPAPRPAAPPAARAPAVRVQAPPKKKTWVWWVIGGVAALGLFAVAAVVLIMFGTGVLKFPASILTADTPAPELIATSQSETDIAQTLITGALTLWYASEPGSPDEEALFMVIQNAETENPGLHVVASNHSSSTNFAEEYTSAVLAGGGPDLILIGNDYFGDMVRVGVVLPFDGAILDSLTGVKQYALDELTVEGELYGLPQGAQAVALYYNKSLISNGPATTDELLALQQEGQALVVPNYAPYWLYGFWSGFGGQLQDEDGRCIADQEGFVPAVEYILDLQAAGADLQAEYGDAQTRFFEGDGSMIINGPWALSLYEDTLGGDLGVVPLPNGPSGPSRPLTTIIAFYVNPNSANQENAVQLALFLTSQASAQLYADRGKIVPVRNDVSITDPLLYSFSLAATLGTPRPQDEQFSQYWGPFGQMFEDVLNGARTPQAGVQRACEEMNALNGLP